MKYVRDDKANNWGTALFLLLFFLFVTSHSDTAIHHATSKPATELISEFQSNPFSADLVSVIKLPVYSDDWATTFDKLSFRHYDPPLKADFDSKCARKIIVSLLKD